jgi:hypothetical protein
MQLFAPSRIPLKLRCFRCGAKRKLSPMTSTDSASTALMPSRALGIVGALPPALIVAGAAALAYTQAPTIAAQMTRLFAPPPVVTYQPPAPVASIPTPAPMTPPVEKAPEVAATPQPLPVAPPVKHVARKPVARAPHVKVVYVNPAPPQPRYVYPAYAPMPLPIPIPFGGRGGRMFGGFGGLFGRH